MVVVIGCARCYPARCDGSGVTTTYDEDRMWFKRVLIMFYACTSPVYMHGTDFEPFRVGDKVRLGSQLMLL